MNLQRNSLDWVAQVAYTTRRLFAKNSLQNHAAATAFYFMLSATPLLLLLSYGMQWLGKLAETYVPATMLFAALYNQLQLETLTEVGFLPRQTQLAAGGVGLLTLLLSSRGLVNAAQAAFRVIFPTEGRRRRFVTSWLLPLVIIPIAFGLMGLAGLVQAVLSFFTHVELIGATHGILLQALNSLFMLLVLWLLVFLAFWRLPVERPPAKQSAIVALLASFSLFALFALFDHFFRLENYQSLYGALGGAVFVLIGAYFACLVFYLWAQCLFAITRVDVEALEKLLLGGSEGASKLEGFVFGRANRLLEKYGKCFHPGEVLIEENHESQEAYFLYSGRVAAYKKTNGEERRLGPMQEGQLFGEMAYLLKEKRTATVRAETEVVAIVLPPEMLEQLMRNSALLSRHIIATLCQRLEQMNKASPCSSPG